MCPDTIKLVIFYFNIAISQDPIHNTPCYVWSLGGNFFLPVLNRQTFGEYQWSECQWSECVSGVSVTGVWVSVEWVCQWSESQWSEFVSGVRVSVLSVSVEWVFLMWFSTTVLSADNVTVTERGALTISTTELDIPVALADEADV